MAFRVGRWRFGCQKCWICIIRELWTSKQIIAEGVSKQLIHHMDRYSINIIHDHISQPVPSEPQGLSITKSDL